MPIRAFFFHKNSRCMKDIYGTGNSSHSKEHGKVYDHGSGRKICQVKVH